MNLIESNIDNVQFVQDFQSEAFINHLPKLKSEIALMIE